MRTFNRFALGLMALGAPPELLEAAQRAAADSAEPPAVRMALQSIARDEARHAELAWAFVRWALAVGDASLRARVAAAFERALAQASSAAASGPADDLPRSAHGFLCSDELRRLRLQAIAEVVRPAAAALVARPYPSTAMDALPRREADTLCWCRGSEIPPGICLTS